MVFNEEKPSIHNRGVLLRCDVGHHYFVPYTCSASRDPCVECLVKRAKRFIFNFLYRYQRSTLGFIPWEGNFYMWTLGTNLLNDYYFDWDQDRYETPSITAMTRMWTLFHAKAKKFLSQSGYHPIVKVLEAGTTGDRLHWHFINYGKIPHAKVLKTWRSVTEHFFKELSNVNVNGKDPLTGIASLQSKFYIAKYTGKSLIRYSFLNDLYKAPKPPRSTSCKEDDTPFELIIKGFWGTDLEIWKEV